MNPRSHPRSDVAVIGAGPSGSCAAAEMAGNGHSVIVFESRKEVGKPVNCGEALSKNTLEAAGLSTDGPWIVNEINGYRIRSPSGENLFSATEGFNIRRDIFDKELVNKAVESGAVLKLKSPVLKINNYESGWTIRSKDGIFKSDYLVLACGMNKTLIEQAFPDYSPVVMRSLGAKIDIPKEGNELLFHVKGELEGGYGWFFPRGDEINIGVVTPNDPAEDLKWLMRIHDLHPSSIKRYQGGLLPINGMERICTENNAILVGDSGGFTNPISKGGIIGAVLSGKEGGKAVSKYLSGDTESLENWKREMIEHPAFTPMNLDRMRILSSLNDELLDHLTSIAKGRDIWSIRKTEIIKEAWKRPNLVRSLRGTMRLIKGGKEWARWAF